MVPRDLVPWGTGWSYFRRGTGSGCTTIHERRSVGPPFAIRTHPPAILASQSVKTGEREGLERGFDGGKLIKGRNHAQRRLG